MRLYYATVIELSLPFIKLYVFTFELVDDDLLGTDGADFLLVKLISEMFSSSMEDTSDAVQSICSLTVGWVAVTEKDSSYSKMRFSSNLPSSVEKSSKNYPYL